MNGNIFSCTVPPLMVIGTQIIHPELLQSLCINPCVPLGSIFLANICARAEASAGARRRVRARVDVCAHTHPSPRALRQRGSSFTEVTQSEKKKLVKFFLHTDVRLKRTDGQVCPSVHPRPKPTSEPPCPSS